VIRTRLIAAAVALAAVCTMPGPAAAQTQPDERAAAREFAYAAYRLRVKLRTTFATKAELGAVFTSPGCREIAEETFPKRARAEAGVALAEAILGVEYGRMGPALTTFAAELDRVPTADPALRAGRDAWQTGAAALARFVPVTAADACVQLRRWADAGYPAGGAPAFQPEAVRQELRDRVTSDDHATAHEDLRLQRAATRMLQLGVTRSQARRFSGRTLFRGDPFVDEVVGTGAEESTR
jgi:hypothetical protein